MNNRRAPLEYYLSLQYPLNVIASEDGGYVIEYPDLPGCLTQVETLEEVPAMAEEARQLWIETAYEDDHDIPLPSYPESYSGKFVVRVPKSLHRRLTESAEHEGVSLNQHVVALLAESQAMAGIMRKLGDIEMQLASIQAQLRYQVTGIPGGSRARSNASHFQILEPVAA